MRTWTITVAAVLCISVTAALPVSLAGTVMAEYKTLADKMVLKHRKIPRGRAFEHVFRPKQDATCDRAAYAEAISRGIQACPSLAGLVAGTVKEQDFLPTFCGSECHQVLQGEFAKHAQCVDDQTRFLLQFLSICETRPHCYKEENVKEMAAFGDECGSKIEAITNVTDSTTTDAAKQACEEGTCLTRQKEIFTKFGECITDMVGQPVDAEEANSMLAMLCEKPAGEYCTVALRGLGETSSTNNEALEKLCSPCIDSFMKAVAYASPEGAIGAAFTKNVLCGRATPGDSSSAFCFPIALGDYVTILAAQMSGSSTAATFNTVASTVCATGDHLSCTPRTLAMLGTMMQMSAYENFKSCVKAGGSTTMPAACKSAAETALTEAASLRVMSTSMCQNNGSPTSATCFEAMMTLAGAVKTPCWTTCQSGANVDCAAEMNAVSAVLGCCGDVAGEFVATLNSSFPGNFLPAGKYKIRISDSIGDAEFSFDANKATVGRPDRSKRAVAPVATCQNASSDPYSTYEGGCAAVTTVADRSLPVYVSNTALSARTGAKDRLGRAIGMDLASALGVPPHYIRGITIAEDSSITVASKSSSSRRQTTSSGIKVSFSVDGSTATTAASRFDDLVSKNELLLVAAAVEMDAVCPECLDANAQSIVVPNVQPTTRAAVEFTPANRGGAASASAMGVAVISTAVVVLAML